MLFQNVYQLPFSIPISFIYFRVSFGWINFGKKKIKPWWKRKEYKIPEEHYKIFKQPAKTSIQKFQKQFSYHNSSQFRHWILGTSILLIFVTLGCVTNMSEERFSMLWSFRENNSFLNLFCHTMNENVVFSCIMAHGVKLRKYQKDKKHIDMSNREDCINNLRNDLENVVQKIRTLENANLVRFLQHFVSYLIFGVALMIDYKGNPSKSIYSICIILFYHICVTNVSLITWNS